MKHVNTLLAVVALCCRLAMGVDCPSPGDYCSGSLTDEELVLVKSGQCAVLQCPPMVCPSYDDFCHGEITKAQANLVDLGRCPTPLCVQPRVCCEALSVTCLACSDGLTVQEYCETHPDLNEDALQECNKLVENCPTKEAYCDDEESIEYSLLMQTNMCVKPDCEDTQETGSQDAEDCPTQLAYCTGTLTKAQTELLENGDCEELFCHSLCPDARAICKQMITEDEKLMIQQGFCPTPMCVNSLDFMFDIENLNQAQTELTIPHGMPEYVSQIDWADKVLSVYLNTPCEDSKADEIKEFLESMLDDVKFSGGCRVSPVAQLSDGEKMQVSYAMDINVCFERDGGCEEEPEPTAPPSDDGSLTGIKIREEVPTSQAPVAIAGVVVALCLLVASIVICVRSKRRTAEIFDGTDAKEVVVIKAEAVETPQAVANV